MANVNKVEVAEQDMNVCFSCDNNYIIHLGVTIASIIHNAELDDKLKFYVLDGGIDKSNIRELTTYCNNKDVDIEFISVDREKLDGLIDIHKSSTRFTAATYYRFAIADLLPNLDKVVYLDCDIIVKSSLKELWNMDLRDNYVGACDNISPHIDNNYKNALGIDKSHVYFNAGVLLINTKKWREDNTIIKLYEINSNQVNKLKHYDQDVLNIAFQGKALLLPIKWNMQHLIYYDAESYYDDAVLQPNILHFSCVPKPWDEIRKCSHPMAFEYLNYKRISVWNKVTKNKTFFHRMRDRAIKRLDVLQRFKAFRYVENVFWGLMILVTLPYPILRSIYNKKNKFL